VRQAVARAPDWYLTGTSRYIVDDDGVTVDDDMCLRFYRWGFFDRAKQTADHLLLYVHPVLHVRVPVAALTPEQLQAVRAQRVTRDILRPRPFPPAEEAIEAR
jgi:hypothetical protein